MLFNIRHVFALVALIPEVFAALFAQRQGIQKRTNSTTIPSPLVILASEYWDGDNGEWSSFALRVGTPAQVVRVLVSTNSPETLVVLSQGCTTQAVNPVPNSCSTSRGGIFNPNSSTTWQEQGLYGINGDGVGLEENLGYKQNAEYGLETLGLGYTAGANGPTLENQTVAGIATVSPFYLGVLGLSTQPVNYSTIGNYSTPSYFSTLRSQQLIPSLSWSYTAGAKYRLKNGQYAQLIFGGYDQSRFTTNSASFTLAGDINRDTVVSVQSITYSGTTQSTLLATPIYAFIESTDTNLWLPSAACDAFVKAFGLSLDNSTGLYLINSTQYSKVQTEAPEVTFTIANSLSGGQTVNIVLPFSAFTLSASYPFTTNDTYYFPLKKAANETQYTLGRTFLQEAYLTVDYERGNFSVSQCLWNDGAASDIVSIVSSSYNITTTTSSPSDIKKSKPKSTAHGVVIGVTIGAVALIVITILGYFLYRHRKRPVSKVPTEDVALAKIDNDKKDKDEATESPAPGYKKFDSNISVHRTETDNELPSTSEIYQLPDHRQENEDYFSASHRMQSERRVANTHEIAGTALVYELSGDLPTPVEMDDERSRRLLSVSNAGGRPGSKGSGNSKARNTSPVPSCLTT